MARKEGGQISTPFTLLFALVRMAVLSREGALPAYPGGLARGTNLRTADFIYLQSVT